MTLLENNLRIYINILHKKPSLGLFIDFLLTI